MEDKKRQDIEYGIRARALLADPLLMAALASIREESLNQSIAIPGSREDDVRAREDARREVLAIDRLKSRLEILVSNGEMAKR